MRLFVSRRELFLQKDELLRRLFVLVVIDVGQLSALTLIGLRAVHADASFNVRLELL